MVTRTQSWAVGTGTVMGREHARRFRANQDGWAATEAAGVAVGVVTDGCSSGAFSEVGARFGAAWLARWLPIHARRGVAPEVWAEAAGVALARDLAELAALLCPEPRALAATVHDFLLFSWLAALVDAESDTAVILGRGDGAYAIGGRSVTLDPGPDNAPDYLAYALLGGDARPTVHHVGSAEAIDGLVVATDGAVELEARAAEPLRDGTAPGGLAQFFAPRYAKNPSLVGKRLVTLGEIHGRLRDDTTVAVLQRRRPCAPW